MRSIMIGLLSLLLFATSAQANQRYTDIQSFNEIVPGAFFDMTYACPLGELVTGGYSLQQSAASGLKILVTQSHPLSLTAWSVRIRNVDSVAIWGQRQISIICTS